MRYLVLIVMAAAIAVEFVVLREALSEAGERFYATLGFAAIMLSGPLYLVWNAFFFGIYFGKEHSGHTPEAIVSLGDTLDIILDLGVVLPISQPRHLRRRLKKSNGSGAEPRRIHHRELRRLTFSTIRGLQYRDPISIFTQWYNDPGFVVGIPAVPFIMPFLFGVILLRRAGDERS